MNVYPRLKELFDGLRETDGKEANILRTEVSKIFSTNGLSPSLMEYLYVLDRKPWRDYLNSSAHEYRLVGNQTLEELLHAAELSKSDHTNLDLRPDECLTKIQEYMYAGCFEDFAIKVQQLMINLDELVQNFPNRRNTQQMEQDLSIKDHIDLLARKVFKVPALQDEIKRFKKKHEEETQLISEYPADQRRALEEEYNAPIQELCQNYQLKYEENMKKEKEKLKRLVKEFTADALVICRKLQNEIQTIIAEIDAHRLAVKRGRVHQLKPVLPPMETLSGLNRRCCEKFELLAQLENICTHLDSEPRQKVFALKRELIHNVFIIELQPPPVLKLESKSETGRTKTEKDGARKPKPKTEREARPESKHESKFFSIGVRILGAASFVDLQVAAERLKFTVHLDKDQIERVLSSPGYVDKSQCFCQINCTFQPGNKKNGGNIFEPRSNIRRIFEKMKLVQVPKPEDGHRQLFENVTDKKCAIIMSVNMSDFGVVKVLCEPVVMTTATVQTGPALGTVFWDAAFSTLRRKSYEEQDEVPWPLLASEIGELFNTYIPKRPLTQVQLRSIGLHVFKAEDYGCVQRNLTNQKMTRRNFMKEPKVEDSNWRWLFSCLNLIRQDPHDKNWEGLAKYWQEGLVLGFVTKKEAETIISQEKPGTFLIRFRGTGIEKSNRDCPRASLSVVYRKTDDGQVSHVSEKLRATDIQGINLGNCLQQLKNGDTLGIQFLYPINKTFDDAFGEFIDEGKTDYGYSKLVSILAPPDKHFTNQVAMEVMPEEVATNLPTLNGHDEMMYPEDCAGQYVMTPSPAGSEVFVNSPQSQVEVPLHELTLSHPNDQMEDGAHQGLCSYPAMSPEVYVPSHLSDGQAHSPGSMCSAQSQSIMSGIGSPPQHGSTSINNPGSPLNLMESQPRYVPPQLPTHTVPYIPTPRSLPSLIPGQVQNLSMSQAQLNNQVSSQNYTSLSNASPYREQGSPQSMTQLENSCTQRFDMQGTYNPSDQNSVYVQKVMNPSSSQGPTDFDLSDLYDIPINQFVQ